MKHDALARPCLWRKAASLIVVAAIVLASAPAALAAPDAESAPAIESAPGTPPALALSLDDLGASKSAVFDMGRNVVRNSLAFQVPQGLIPTEFTAVLDLPVKLRYGALDVTQGPRTLGRIELPTDTTSTRIVIPLNGVQVFGNWANVTLTATAIPPEGYCFDPDFPIRYDEGTVVFSGTEVAPDGVSGFLPSVLNQLTIGIPARPSPQESEAAVQLTAEVAYRYGGQIPNIVLVPLPDGATTLGGSPASMERRVVIREGPNKGVSVINTPTGPSMLISGPAADLTKLVNLMGDEAQAYALAPTVKSAQLPDGQKFLGDSFTLASLNRPELISTAMQPWVGVVLDQTKFGHPLANVRIHLLGSHTPLPSSMGGEVAILVDGRTVDHWASTEDGIIDRWVDIPDRLLRRTTRIELTVRTTGYVGGCGDYSPITLRIDDDTELNTQRATTPILQGFQSLPQSLTVPAIQIGLGDDPFGDTVRASQIVAGLQRTSSEPLKTTVTGLQQAIDSGKPAVLISANGWNVAGIPLPFSVDQGRVEVMSRAADGKNTTLVLDRDIRYGSLQTVFDGKRTMLIASSNGAPAQLDEALTWMSGKRGRWASLDGRAVVSTPGKDPFTVLNPTIELSDQVENTGASFTWWAIGGGLITASALSAAVILRRLRSNAPEPLPEPDGVSGAV